MGCPVAERAGCTGGDLANCSGVAVFDSAEDTVQALPEMPLEDDM